ncbi:hypothetical protein FACS1894216_09580 [Synergistales bacterium]|nr:hypothetical protein FACS1894216_09580 [Synergistales bacterium]
MLYKKYERTPRNRRQQPDGDNSGGKKRISGSGYTFAGFFAAAGCLAILKVMNPALDIRSAAIMLACTGLACVILARIGRK